MARLRVLSGPLQIQPFELNQTNTTIGRAKPNVFRFEHRSVSKYHALIISDADGDLLFDLDSTNGTFLNNQRISSAPLKHGDHIRLGEFVVGYETAEVTESAAAPKPPDTSTSAPKPVLRLRPEPGEMVAAPPPPAPRPVVPAPAPTPAAAPQPVVAASEARPASPPPAPQKATGSQDKAFIRLPGDKKATQGTAAKPGGFMNRVLGRGPEKPEEKAPPPPAPHAPSLSPPPRPSPEPAITAPLPRRPTPAPAPPPEPEPEPAPAEAAPAEEAHVEPPAPVEKISSPPQPAGEQVIQKPAGGGGPAGERILKKPGGTEQQSGDRVLLRPPAKKSDEITLKKPGAPGK